MNGGNDVFIRLGVDDSTVPQPVQRTNAAIASIGKTAEVSARQTAAAMRQLPAQFTDVATQLAGGANPLLVLLQQGGQIKDSFGGVGNAIRGIGAAISPVTLAVGGAAAAVGAFAVAALQGVKEGEGLRDVIALTGNAAGLTGARFQATAEQVAAASQQTVGAAKDIVTQLAATGQVTSSVLATTALAVARVADVSGEDSKKVAADFAGMANGVAKWAAEHNKAWNFITVEQYKYIRRLEEQGKAEQAMEYVSQQVITRLADQQRNLGFLETAWDAVRKAASNTWDAMLGLGREQTTRQQLDIAMERLKALGDNLTPKAREAAEQRIQYLKEQIKLENQQADARSRNAAVNRAAIADEQKREGTKPDPLSAIQGDIAKGQYDYLRTYVDSLGRIQERNSAALQQQRQDFLRSEKAFYAELDKQRKAELEAAGKDPLGEFIEDQLNAQRRRDDRRLEQNDRYIEQLLDSNERAAIELIQDERTRGEALIALDAEIARRRIEASDMTPEQRTRALSAVEERSRLQQIELSKRIRTTADEAGDAIYGSTYSAFNAAFTDAEGKPLKAFGNALQRELTARAAAALSTALTNALVGQNGQGGGLGALLSLFGGGGNSSSIGNDTTQYTTDPYVYGGSFAVGTNYVPRDMLATVHEGEAIVPKKYNPAAGGQGMGGGNYTFAPQITVDARTDQAQVAAIAFEATRRASDAMYEDLKSRGVLR